MILTAMVRGSQLNQPAAAEWTGTAAQLRLASTHR